MPIDRLDHVNIRTANLDRMVSFYESALGFTNDWRPPFPFPGAWLYAGKHAVVHLIGVDTSPGMADDLQLEHFAFTATDMDGFVANLEKLEIGYQIRNVPGTDIVQVNLWDPDGNHLHVDFRI